MPLQDPEDPPTVATSMLAQCYEEKAKGNELYKEGLIFVKHTKGKNDITQACAHYAKALAKLEPEYDASIAEHRELKRDILLNLAAGGLKLETYDQVISCCTEIIQNIDPTSCKARYRRALAYQGLTQLEAAKKDLEDALALNNKDSGIRKALKDVISRLKTQEQRDQLQKETEAGKRKQLEQRTRKTIDLESLMQNGGRGEKYYWGSWISNLLHNL